MGTLMRQLFQQFVTSFFLLKFIRRYKNRASLMKIRAAQAYVLGVKKTRLFFLGVLGVFVAFVFLFNGLSLLQTAFFTYSMWSNEMKFTMALMIGGVEFIGAVGILFFLFREETWVKFSGIRKVVNLVVGQEGDKNGRPK